MDIENEARKLLLENRRTTDGFQYTIPSADHYPYQWLWDSCFHAIVLAKFEPEAARQELKALLSKQFASGMVPHIIYWTPGILHLFQWGVDGTSSLTQPPMIAYAALEIHRRDPDMPFLRSVFPSLVAYYRFLLSERDPHGHHLVSIINPDESGEDNSPRFDIPLSVSPGISLKEHLTKRTELIDRNRECNFDAELCMRDFFWVKDVLFNTVLVENLRALSKIAGLLKHPDYERSLARDAEDVANAMRERMFEGGMFYSTMGAEYTKLKVATWAHFVPLFAGLYTPPEAEAVVEKHLKNPDTFCAPFGIRTTSRKETAYRSRADDFSWRGPIWIAEHWFIYHGLTRYGFTKEAEDIRTKSISLIERSGFSECFDPETGEGFGARNFTWGALVLDMIEA
ncbi:hypothetical protein A2853_01110 [Candidatus Kaiserbacteria bacterium RIFCSPHIGHO2_01_FULL_55_17]|uniref:Mannosylglycerate hydrolase MGH1-like glycoside hydrolase domain-containing protein n=1 Tax=Candidatus Kaiserbacteria bacterium RIFCSPHIGHO2_01_FULL_55_17 TaxID=1798484 RepID=A0A1F6D9E6_9BACT|nr:MAG: hypothetical protein A2853_01110 [Candidatus Kaiserbacteria bacterium RIFCSPHIGHO2_01_FULL_55_17]